MIGIRVDANEVIATGHVMRSITIARQLIKRGEEVRFFIADEFAASLLDLAGMDKVCLHTKWDRLEEEIEVLSGELERAGCTKLLVDSYQVTEHYLGELRKICKVIYIDDMFEAVYPVDMIINYNAYHERFPYKEAYGMDTKLLLGTAYVPLRQEFFLSTDKEREETEMEKQHVLISSGGGDVYNAISGILAEAVNRKGLTGLVFDVVVGSFHKNVDELEALAEEYHQIVLHKNVNHMAELMSRCSAAVSAAGTVLFELCAMQVPTVFFVCADNQKYDSEFFEKEERMLFAGDIRFQRMQCIERICAGIERLTHEKVLREEMKIKLHRVTDGNGASLIAEELISL